MHTTRLSIGQVARYFGLRDSALRYYERHGLLNPPRNAAGQRFYRERDLRELAFIVMCRDGGLRLDEIATMLGGNGPDQRDWQDVATGRLAAIEADIEWLRSARDFLRKALNCTSDHPAVECPYARRQLDEMVARVLGGASGQG